jgi:putative acetyltransferase
VSDGGRDGDVTIRAALAGDVAEVVELVRVVLAEFGLRFGEGSATDEQLLALPDSYVANGGAFWVARAADARLLGTCGVFPVADATFELRKMYLLRDARGGGLGRRLLAHAIDFARAHEARFLVLDTVEEMGAAITFYERVGFRRDDGQIRGSRCTRGYVREL